jgi:hypothetical protein
MIAYAASFKLETAARRLGFDVKPRWDLTG